MAWTLEEALALVRRIQPGCMQQGYYLALAGGVLNKGKSENDLDLVAVPRTAESSEQALIAHLTEAVGCPLCSGAVASATVYEFVTGAQKLEIAVVAQA